MASEIIEFLRPSTTFLQAAPRRVPLENGSYYQSGGSTGATAAYGRENSVPAYSEPTFRDINLFAKELQGKTAISNLLLKRGVSGIRAFVDQDLREQFPDTYFVINDQNDCHASLPPPSPGADVCRSARHPPVHCQFRSYPDARRQSS